MDSSAALDKIKELTERAMSGPDGFLDVCKTIGKIEVRVNMGAPIRGIGRMHYASGGVEADLPVTEADMMEAIARRVLPESTEFVISLDRAGKAKVVVIHA